MLSRTIYKKQRGRRLLTALATLSLVTGTFVIANTALAVHDTGAFEMDGNATNNPAVAGDDWDNVCHQVLTTDCSTSSNTTGATAVSWVAEPNLNSSIFTGGGSKDPQDINQWAWKDGAGGLPDKDNLLHSFAARYSLTPSTACPAGTATTCELLYFGSDRYDNSGDAQQGFWFFQNPIGLGTTPLGGGTSFTGVHKDGDVLVISDFSNGGTTSTISVYKWDHTVNGNLALLATSTAAKCSSAAPQDAFCGIVNPATITLPWTFVDKSGTPTNQALNGEFYEGGINLSLLGLSSECFASVASETRSSTSTTATLKDFVLGNFGRCTSGLVTTPSDSAGVAIPATGASIGAGADVSVTDSAALTISGAPTWSGTLKFFLCGPSDANPCTTGGTQIGPAAGVTVTNADTQPFLSAVAHVTSAGTYCWRSTFTHITTGVPDASDASSGECFTVNPLTPSIPTTASGTVTIGTAVSDSAALSGTANEPGSPVINPTTAGGPALGSITFKLYGPSATAVCDASNLVFTSSAIPVSGDASYGSGNFTPTTAGTYRWIASYTGDLPNTNSVAGACGDSNESVVVGPKTPTITTTQSPTTNASLGTATTDTATIGNTANKPDGTAAGGTVTFKLYGPRAVPGTANCSSNLVYTSTAYAVSGNGTYPTAAQSLATPNSFTPTLAGTYDWIATYTGDSPNTTGPVSSVCGDEPVTFIQLQPAISTAQTFTIKDSATITVGTGAGDLAGSVRFRLYNNATCTAGTGNVNVLYDSNTAHPSGIAVSGASPQTVNSDTTTITTSQTVLSWLVEYTSTNSGHTNVTSSCNTEHSSLSITNG